MKQRGEVVELEQGVKVVGERGFECGQITVVRTGGRPEEWEVLARVKL